MRFRVFQYALPAPSDLPELNGFLASHRIASVAQHVVDVGGGPMLLFVVQSTGDAPKAEKRSTPQVDYKQVLGKERFAVYERLRRVRKLLADQEGVPAYAIFTNAQLAEIVTREPRSAVDLRQVPGIGEARADKYAEPILAALAEQP